MVYKKGDRFDLREKNSHFHSSTNQVNNSVDSQFWNRIWNPQRRSLETEINSGATFPVALFSLFSLANFGDLEWYNRLKINRLDTVQLAAGATWNTGSTVSGPVIFTIWTLYGLTSGTKRDSRGGRQWMLAPCSPYLPSAPFKKCTVWLIFMNWTHGTNILTKTQNISSTHQPPYAPFQKRSADLWQQGFVLSIFAHKWSRTMCTLCG